MSFYVSSGIYSFLLNLSIGVFVLLQNPRKKQNVLFALFSLTVGGWSVGSFFINVISDKTFGLIVLRCNYLFAVWLPAVYIHFVYSLTGKFEKPNRIKLAIAYTFSTLLSFVVFTNMFISGLHIIRNTRFYISSPGPFYYAFFVFFAIGMTEVLAHTFFRLKEYTEIQRLQIKYITAANAIAIFAGFEYFSSVFGFLGRPPLDDYILVLYLSVVAYAIVRHRLMDIEVIIKKTLVFAGLTSFVFGVFAGITFLVKEILSTYVQVPSIVANIASIAIVVFLYDPLRNFLVNITDKFLSQKKFNYAKVLRETSKDIALVTSLNELTRRIIAVLIRKAKTKNTAIFIRNVKDNHLELKGCYGYGRKNRPDIVINMDNELVEFLNEHQQPFTRQAIEEEKNKTNNDAARAELSLILQLMNILKAQVVVPSFLGSGTSEITKDQKAGLSLRSLLILGEKKSDEDYYEEDLDMLATLAQEHAIAFENARLFDEAIERSKELQAMNTELVKVQGDLVQSLTDIELASKKLHETQAALIVAEKNATMVGMAKAIGHEVNNPLSTVAGRAMFIQKTRLPKVKDIIERYKGKITAEEYELAKTSFEKIDDDSNRIATCAKRIEIVVKTLTGIMKESSGEMQPLSFLVLWKEAAEAVRFNTYEENLSSCEIIEGIASNLIVQGNLEQLIQVFLNLIKNAYEAMMAQAEKCITVKADVDPDDPRYALIVVSDNGPGIPPDVLPRIWSQGFSTKKKTGTDIGAIGQGQGLYIVKHMVESVHKGTIIAESMPGNGTSFIVRLPIAEEHVVMRATDNSENR